MYQLSTILTKDMNTIGNKLHVAQSEMTQRCGLWRVVGHRDVDTVEDVEGVEDRDVDCGGCGAPRCGLWSMWRTMRWTVEDVEGVEDRDVDGGGCGGP